MSCSFFHGSTFLTKPSITRARSPILLRWQDEEEVEEAEPLLAVEASLLFTEPLEGGPIRVSLRSKGGVDVARFAEQFGGGGHARASGLKVEGTLPDVRQRVVDAMIETLEKAGPTG